MTPLAFSEALVATQPVTIRRRIAWGECDPAGVVYTPRFVEFAVSARDWFMRTALDYTDRPHPSHPAITYPMRTMAFDFTSYLAADDWFDMVVRVTAISVRTFTVEIAATRVADGVRAFTGTLVSVCVAHAGGPSVALPATIRAALIASRDHGTPV